MVRHPTDLLRVLVRHYPLLSAMCRENQRFTSDTELEAFCASFLAPGANSGAIAGRLREVGAVTQATGDWAPPPYLRAFLAEIEHRHSLAGPGVVRGWIEKLSGLAARLEDHTSSAGVRVITATVVELLEEITDTLASVAGSVGGNCDRIGAEVSRYRGEENAAQIRARLARLIELHSSYLEPVLGLVDIGGEFHAVCERLASNCAALAEASTRDTDQALCQAAATAGRDVIWLRRSTLRRAHEANRELGPLCEAAARESLIARGVNRALEAIASGRWEQLGLRQSLQVVIDQDGPLLGDRAAAAVVSAARDYRVEPPPLLGEGDPSAMDMPWGAGDLLEELDAHSHVVDVLEWICERVGWEAADTSAGLLHDLLESDAGGFLASEESRCYPFAAVDVDARIWSWRPLSND